MLQNGVHCEDIAVGPGPRAVLAAVARREVDGGPVREVHGEAGGGGAAATPARGRGPIGALGGRAERNGGSGRTATALGGDTGCGGHGGLLSARDRAGNNPGLGAGTGGVESPAVPPENGRAGRCVRSGTTWRDRAARAGAPGGPPRRWRPRRRPGPAQG